MDTALTLKVQKTLTQMNRYALELGELDSKIDQPSVYWGAMQGYLLALKHLGLEDEAKIIYGNVRGISPTNVSTALLIKE